MNIRKISMVFLAVLLCAAIGLNWNYNDKKEGETAKLLGEAAYVSKDVQVEESEYESKRLERDMAREKAIAMADEILADKSASQEQYDAAHAEKMKLAKRSETETVCEIQLKTKGFSEPLVFISDEEVAVTVKHETLETEKLIQIQELISSNTGILSGKIKNCSE